MSMRAIALSGLVFACASGCHGAGSRDGAEMDAGSDADADTDSDSDTDTDSDSETDSETEWETDTQCAGQFDFTPCEIVTAPDRSYDICVEGACVSPGCGTWQCNVPGPHFAIPDTGQRMCYDDDGVWGDPDGGASDGGIACPSADDSFFGQDAQYGWDDCHDAAERFTRDTSTSGEPMVLDDLTGLVWQGCVAGLSGDACEGGAAIAAGYYWAVPYCEALSWGGHDDWRLPDEFELHSILDYDDMAGVDPSAFPNLQGGVFWSSSTFYMTDGYDYKWCVGAVIDGCSAPYLFGVLCVPGAPTPVPPRFTRDTSTSSEPVVVDAATGLTWQGCADGLSGDGCEEGAAAAWTWEEALVRCEELSWGGGDDWRLPNAKELQSIVDHTTKDPAIDPVAFPATPSAAFWSSTSVATTLDLVPSTAWYTRFEMGTASGSFDGYKTSALHVRCVRGGT
jgi:hypothetical protein